jgi:hypothetical protein
VGALVKVMPNKAIVTATVKRIEKTEEPNIFSAEVELLSSESVAGYPNFTERFVGKTVEVMLLLNQKLSTQQNVSLLMKYEGDERGGCFLAEEA